MKYALIGFGRISVNHIAATQQNNSDIVALCDIVAPEHINETFKKFEITKSTKKYLDYKEMLLKEKPELVLAIYKSAAEGISVKFPLDKCSTLDYKGGFKDE